MFLPRTLSVARFTSAVDRKTTQHTDLIRNSEFELCSGTSLRVEAQASSLDDNSAVQGLDSISSISKQHAVRLTVDMKMSTDRPAPVLRSNREQQT